MVATLASPRQAEETVPEIPIFSGIFPLSAGRIRSALAEIRGFIPGNESIYRGEKGPWLRANLGMLITGIERTHERVIQKRINGGQAVAERIMMGGYLGAEVVRRTVEAGEVTLRDCRANLGRAYVGEFGFLIDSGTKIDERVLAFHFGEAAAEALGEITSNDGRAMCSQVIGRSILGGN